MVEILISEAKLKIKDKSVVGFISSIEKLKKSICPNVRKEIRPFSY